MGIHGQVIIDGGHRIKRIGVILVQREFLGDGLQIQGLSAGTEYDVVLTNKLLGKVDVHVLFLQMVVINVYRQAVCLKISGVKDQITVERIYFR